MNPTEWMKKNKTKFEMHERNSRISGIHGHWTKSITGPLTPERGPSQTEKSIFCQRTPYKYHTWKALLGPKILGRFVATTWYQPCFVERRQVACLFHMRRLDRGSRVICFYPKELENNYYSLLAYNLLTIFWKLLITNYQNMVISDGCKWPAGMAEKVE